MSKSITSISGATILCFCLVHCFSACNNSETKSDLTSPKENQSNTPHNQTVDLKESQEKQENVDSLITKPSQIIPKSIPLNTEVTRLVEGFSDDHFNGKQLLIQLELSEKTFNKNPDTIRNYLNEYYRWMERSFPRSIACDFENGISREQIHYPTINFKVQLFENEKSEKPYKIVEHTIYNKHDQAKISASQAVPVHSWVDQMPTVFQDKQDVRSYLLNSIIPPRKVKEQGISGVSWLTFIVELDGSLSDIRVEKAFESCLECDEEVLRVARLMPLLNPGKLNGIPVRVQIKQGVSF